MFEVTVGLLCCAFLKKLVIDTDALVFCFCMNLSSTTSVSAANLLCYHDPDLDPGSLPRKRKHDYIFNAKKG